MMRSLKVAMIGSKGLPAVFGGIERHVEEVGKRLVSKGHRVTVYGRKPFSSDGEYMGMKIKVLPSIPTKNLDAATNTLAATLHASFGDFDIVHYHGIGPSLFCWIASALGKRTVSTIHAPDYRQKKWGAAARRLLKLGEKTAVHRSDAPVAVSRLMAASLEERYGSSVTYIPNGTTLYDVPPFEEAAELGIREGHYILTVGRFIVERGFHTLLEAFRCIETGLRLVIVGDARFEKEYAARLRALADERVLFPGYISGRTLNELYAHCSFYVLPSLVEGLPISLLEAMSFSRPVLMSDIDENLEVAEGIAVTFRRGDAEDLERGLKTMLEMEERERVERGRRGRMRVEGDYTWDEVADRIEELYFRLSGRKAGLPGDG